LRRRIAGPVESRGLSLEQYNILRILRGAGTAGLPTLEVAARMIERTPAITRLMDKLEQKGFVDRERCPTDRRQVFCRITPAALALLTEMDSAVIGLDTQTIQLPEVELEQLLKILQNIRESLT
jgi:DNA-binding MarR family transcriptional regulator